MNNGQTNKFRADISTCMSENHTLWHKSMQRENINRESTFDVLTHTERQRSSNIQILTSHHSPDVKKGFVKEKCYASLAQISLHSTFNKKYKFSKYAED